MSARLPILSDGKSSEPVFAAEGEYDAEELALLDRLAGDTPSKPAGQISRRGFMGAAGASIATASAGLTGCIRKPREYIVPFAQRPEDLVPGDPTYFATATQAGGEVLALLVESQDGRPTKVEGNPRSPAGGGGTNRWAQASVMDLYDPDRSLAPVTGGNDATLVAVREALGSLGKAKRAAAGRGLAILTQHQPSPTLNRLLAELISAMPQARLFAYSPDEARNARAAAAALGLGGLHSVADLASASVILSLDCDFLGSEGAVAAQSKAFAAGRKVTGTDSSMNRLYVAEAVQTITGTMADNRLRIASSQIGGFAQAVAKNVFASISAPAGADVSGLAAASDEPVAKWASEVAKDLLANQGKSVVLVGENQPASVHALGHLLNAALGNVASTLHFTADADAPGAGSLEDLGQAIGGGAVDTLVMLGGNPAYDAPADLDFASLLGSVGTSVHVSSHRDETSAKATWHIARSHFLESWGDWRATDGTPVIQQPLIAPLFATLSDIEVVGVLLGSEASGHDQVLATWKATLSQAGPFDLQWRRWLHQGHLSGLGTPPVLPGAMAPLTSDAGEAAEGGEPTPLGPTYAWAGMGSLGAQGGAEVSASSVEVHFPTDSKVYDGRYANNPWLQELPDPMSKLTWDNAALMSPATARGLGVDMGDLVTISLDGRSLDVPAMVLPGTADHVVALSLGYGREAGGSFAAGAGFNAYMLRGSGGMRVAGGATIAKGQGNYELASTQDYALLKPKLDNFLGWEPPNREFVRQSTLEDYKVKPDFVQEHELLPAEELKSLWTEPNERGGQQWGMSIDLNTCTGCSNCTVACQSENNISVVGKERVLQGREMHWIRLDRYFEGDEDAPRAVVQPMGCAHCETAPCEQVCPVAATAHSTDGLNDIAYNRCIGTRYCANNCPFKVRRFNYFAFAKENDASMPLVALQRNPDVTVRFRGVIEKCSYCVQRISAAKIDAKAHGDGVVPDGTIVPACAQSCPTDAIVFGDINDPNSVVSKRKADSRDYALLSELNIHPRTTYLAKLRNPNPELA